MKTIVVCPECGAEREKWPSELLRLKTAYCRGCSHSRDLVRYAAIKEYAKQGVSFAEIGRRLVPPVTRERIRQIAVWKG